MEEILTARQESGISIAAHSENHSAKTEIGTVWLPPASVGKIGAVETLSFKGTVEEQVNYAHGDVIDDLGCFCEVCEPLFH